MYEKEDLERETGACPTCGANVRLRGLAYLAGKKLFRRARPVPDWPVRPDIVAYGISDWPTFSTYLAPKIGYVNTQFDRAIYSEQMELDVTKPPDSILGTADIIICSEVLEHVAPPVQEAFDGLARILKPGGALIFSVPFTFGRTVEHFPLLHDWKLVDGRKGRVLVNTTADGRAQRRRDLVFHGGGETVLEMRVFGYRALRRHFRRAGFRSVRVLDHDVPEFGIRFRYPWSRLMVAVR